MAAKQRVAHGETRLAARPLALAVLGALSVACSSESLGRDDADATEEDAYARYARIVAQVAGAVHAGGRITVLGVRGQSLDGVLHDTRTLRVYDDQLVILDPAGLVTRLAVSTHPWESTSTSAPDVDGDGLSDVGMIRPGVYVATAREPSRNIGGKTTFHVKTAATATDRLPGWRDTDHDGVYTDKERAASEARRDALTAVLFHQGGVGTPAAIGCQVLAPDDMKQLVTLVGGTKASFNYVLVDAAVVVGDTSDSE